MKKKLAIRALIGAPIGITVSHVITLLVSLAAGGGEFLPVTEWLRQTAGSELAAVAVQTLSSGVMGAGFGAASVIWEIGSWSLLRQSVAYFFAASVLMLPTAYAMGWMEHSVTGVLGYAGIFFCSFACFFAAQYLQMRREVRRMNSEVRQSREQGR